MDLQLSGKHVLITGGSKGIGLACARGFLEEGAHVSLVSRESGHLETARQILLKTVAGAENRIALYPGDLKDPRAASAIAESAERDRGPIDILINSAGAARRTPPEELKPEHWHDAMHAKYFTYVHMIDPVIKRMAGRGSGVILNVVGMGGKIASPTHLPGGSANAALMLASAGLAAAYGAKGVRVNVINPGPTLTDRLQDAMRAEARLNNITPEEALQRANKKMPLGRIATPEEIANVALFLCSPKASYVSGANIAMDGAMTPIT